MNLLGIYNVGVPRSLCRRLLLSNRKLFIVMAFSTTFTQCVQETTDFGKITQNKGHFAVHGYLRTPIMVPIKSLYAAYYIKTIARQVICLKS